MAAMAKLPERIERIEEALEIIGAMQPTASDLADAKAAALLVGAVVALNCVMRGDDPKVLKRQIADYARQRFGPGAGAAVAVARGE